jgi:Ni,Fe-hydrogenase III small subunit/formate hydrogenlyase subunit 6/NADH:ubiquinone oxidoreductase subunit I
MLKILRQSLNKGIVTTDSVASAPNFRGRPVFDFAAWQDARSGAAVCPTGAISFQDNAAVRTVTVDYGKCIFCGLCAEPAVKISRECELAVRRRADLILTADYRLDEQGRHAQLIKASGDTRETVMDVGERLRTTIHRLLGRSLHIRQVDAGSCNGCEVEIVALNSPVYDLERFGMHFVASPRHADLLLVTGPVTRNMELALVKTYQATPEPRLVVAVGACGCSGGIFGENYATRGAVDAVVPVDIYIPGCPPPPRALLHGLLLAVGRLRDKRGRSPSGETDLS